MSLVPPTAAEVEASSQFELAPTTPDGLKLYVRSLTREVADRIIIGSRDFQFLCGYTQDRYLLVAIRAGKILKKEPKPYGDLERADVAEMLTFMTDRETHPRGETNENQ